MYTETGRTLFWVTTPLKHTPICGVGDGGVGILDYKQTIYVTAVQLPYFPQRLDIYLKDVLSMADHIQIRAGGVRLLTIKGTLTVKDMRTHTMVGS